MKLFHQIKDEWQNYAQISSLEKSQNLVNLLIM